MSTGFLERHATELQREALRTAERSAAAPDDFWLSAAAENQQQAARDAVRELELQYGRERGELLVEIRRWPGSTRKMPALCARYALRYLSVRGGVLGK